MDYLPEVYQDFRQAFPEIAGAYDDLAMKCHNLDYQNIGHDLQSDWTPEQRLSPKQAP